MNPVLADVVIVATYIGSIVSVSKGKRTLGSVILAISLILIQVCDGVVAEFFDGRWMTRLLIVIFMAFFIDSEMNDYLM